MDVTCEVAPHHWTLTDEAVADYDTNTKMSPPLRSQDHVEAIIEGLRDGTIDALPPTTLRITPTKRSSNLIRRRLALPVWKRLSVWHSIWSIRVSSSLERLVELCSTNPARIFGLQDRGTLRPDAWADVTILDPQFQWIV